MKTQTLRVKAISNGYLHSVFDILHPNLEGEPIFHTHTCQFAKYAREKRFFQFSKPFRRQSTCIRDLSRRIVEETEADPDNRLFSQFM
ncbi:MAG: hypothetical protein ACKVIW_16075, partial [bacterium]